MITQIFSLWEATIISVVWSIWFTRNQAILSPCKFLSGVVWHLFGDQFKKQITKMYYNSSIEHLTILRRLVVLGHPSRASRIIPFTRSPPLPGCIKINTDGAASGSAGPASFGVLFHNCRGFVHAYVAILLGKCLAFKVEILVLINVVAHAWKKGWNIVWLKD